MSFGRELQTTAYGRTETTIRRARDDFGARVAGSGGGPVGGAVVDHEADHLVPPDRRRCPGDDAGHAVGLVVSREEEHDRSIRVDGSRLRCGLDGALGESQPTGEAGGGNEHGDRAGSQGVQRLERMGGERRHEREPGVETEGGVRRYRRGLVGADPAGGDGDRLRADGRRGDQDGLLSREMDPGEAGALPHEHGLEGPREHRSRGDGEGRKSNAVDMAGAVEPHDAGAAHHRHDGEHDPTPRADHAAERRRPDQPSEDGDREDVGRPQRERRRGRRLGRHVRSLHHRHHTERLAEAEGQHVVRSGREVHARDRVAEAQPGEHAGPEERPHDERHPERRQRQGQCGGVAHHGAPGLGEGGAVHGASEADDGDQQAHPAHEGGEARRETATQAAQHGRQISR